MAELKKLRFLIRNIDESIFTKIKQDADKNKRSINNEILTILEKFYEKSK